MPQPLRDTLTFMHLPVPAPAPLAMPRQNLRAAPARGRSRPTIAVMQARLIAFGGGAALTVFGGWQMGLALSAGSINILHFVMLGFFTLSFGWIAFAATSAVSGLLYNRSQPRRSTGDSTDKAPLSTRTALVMPVYEEDPASSAAALYAMAEGLIQAGHGSAFEIFVLSDTRDADVGAQEVRVFDQLRRQLYPAMNVWYRRRPQNTDCKAGNIRDFVERWGGRYETMIVLDADSLMAPATLVEMVRRMQADPRLGILQSLSAVAGGHSLFARLQQYSGRVYGSAIARGIAAWQGDDGNYWGHNAAIRVRAFAESCGLPTLAGPRPFGGAILSHDFVEAALMRRAGWVVRMDPDLTDSWEEGPPSLLDNAARDRRWAQGNLQHIKVLSARGLSWTSRAHLIIGIGSYLASPLWLGMLIAGLALSLNVALSHPGPLTGNFQLFPEWPRFDAPRMGWLFVFSMAVLLTPKAIGVMASLADPKVRAGCGGAPRLIVSSLVEIVLSAILAPIQMVMQSHQVWEVVAGRDSGWSRQRRTESTTPWPTLILRHRAHMAIGLATALFLWLLSPVLLVWLSLPLLGLSMAPLLSRLSGSVATGLLLRSAGLLLTPEESAPWQLDRVRQTALYAICRTSQSAALAVNRLAMQHPIGAAEPPFAAQCSDLFSDRLPRPATTAVYGPDQRLPL